MITLKEFRERRQGILTQSLAELTFKQLFEQWIAHNEAADYASEAREWINIVGLIRANEIMDDVIMSDALFQ